MAHRWQVFSRRLRHALELELESQLPGAVTIESAFLYSEPTVERGPCRGSGPQARSASWCCRLFPQASGTTTGAVFDQVGESLRSWRALPDLQLIGNYHDDAGYIGALANSVREHWQKHGRTAQLLMSFHGIPQRCVQRGDAYEQQCQQTATGCWPPHWS